MVPTDEIEAPLGVEIDRLEVRLRDTEQAIAQLRAELAEAQDATRRVDAIDGAVRNLMAGRLGLGIGFLLGLLMVLTA